MAFEVARVHGIIRSNIREDRSPMASASVQGSVVVVGGGSSAAAAAWPDLASSPLGSSSSPRSTETEDDEDDELLLAGLAQTMLNSQDESSSIIQQQRHRGVGGKTHCEARPTVSDIETHKVRGFLVSLIALAFLEACFEERKLLRIMLHTAASRAQVNPL